MCEPGEAASPRGATEDGHQAQRVEPGPAQSRRGLLGGFAASAAAVTASSVLGRLPAATADNAPPATSPLTRTLRGAVGGPPPNKHRFGTPAAEQGLRRLRGPHDPRHRPVVDSGRMSGAGGRPVRSGLVAAPAAGRLVR